LTHPAIVQLVNEMVENNIVETVRDNVDKRKRMVSLQGKEKKFLIPFYHYLTILKSCKGIG